MQAIGAIKIKGRFWLAQLSSDKDKHVLQKHDGKWFAAPSGLYLRPLQGGSTQFDALADVNSVEPPGTVTSRERIALLEWLLGDMFDAGIFESSCEAPSFSASSNDK